MCSPPESTGRIHDAILAAAAIAEVDEVYAIGGAQAIAALAFGAGALQPVDVVVGPGNAYVVEAKRQVFGTVGIDGLAGASEVVILADDTVDPEWVAVDLLAQAEHGPGGAVAVIVWDEGVAERVELALDVLLLGAERRDEAASTLDTGGRVIVVDDPARAVDAANAIAPEHLELMCADADAARPAGPQRGRGLRRRVRTGGPRRLRGRNQSRAAHGRHGPVRERAPHRRLPEAHSRGARRRRGPRPGRSRGAMPSPKPKGCGPTPTPSASGRSFRREREPVPQPRDDLRALEGYHSPQVEVDVRLNTNESPYAPPAAFVERWVDALRDVDWNRYPDRAATELRAALGTFLGQPPARLLCGNGSNEILQTLLLTYGGAGRRALMFEPTYALARADRAGHGNRSRHRRTRLRLRDRSRRRRGNHRT